MFTFVNQPLLWGLLLVGVPVLIHLINLLRHRRIEWAAMEFLLESQKKNSTWIRLKELLLLLLRMAAVAAIVLIVAQPLLDHEWGRRFGGAMTHHVVLLDDSYSMSDRWSGTSAFDEALAAVRRIGARAQQESTAQRFTLLRCSRAAERDGAQPDLLSAIVDADFAASLETTLAKLKPSQASTGVLAALEALPAVLGEPAGEQRVVYLVSDFRRREWDEPTALVEALHDLNDQDVEPFLLNCVRGERANLGVTALAPRPGTMAAGVPLVMDVTVANHGQDAATGVTVIVEDDAGQSSALVFDQVAPRSAEVRSFPAFFATAGEHAVSARLEQDAVLADNVRHTVVPLAVRVPVLIIDGDRQFAQARLLSRALAPGGNVNTGIAPRIESHEFLNDNALDPFAAVYLIDIEHLDDSAVRALEAYVSNGGGVCFFMGERSRTAFTNEALHREGQGLFPLPLLGATQLLVDRLDKAPDFEITDHPVFRVLSGERNSFLSTVVIDRYIAAARDWRPPADSAVRVIARLRNGAPLAVEKPFGRGRVVAFLTTVAPFWNNWARNPSFVAAMLDLQWYLAAQASSQTAHSVGQPIRLTLDPAVYRPEVRLVPPAVEDAGSFAAAAAPSRGSLAVEFGETGAAGIYQIELSTNEGAPEVRRYAVNVDPAEGELAILAGADLARRLEGVRYRYAYADELGSRAATPALGANLSDSLIYLLLAALLAEQALAYSASYHAAQRAEAAA